MIKTIKSNDMTDFDKQVNEFEADPRYSVFATQTHYSRTDGYIDVYLAVIFYKVRP